MKEHEIKIFAGTSSFKLANKIADKLGTKLGDRDIIKKKKNFLYENFCTPFCHFFLASAFAFWHEKRIFAGYEV